MDTLAWPFSVLIQRVSVVSQSISFWRGGIYYCSCVVARTFALLFYLKIYNKNVHIWDSLHYPTEFFTPTPKDCTDGVR